ncbi:MAG TPA: hypothetical protein VK506_00305 [Conexibacter sp.]|nr:hypothetical protein [Conexibacter sp.]
MSLSDRTPELVILTVLVLLVAVGALAGGGGSERGDAVGNTRGATVSRERIDRIAGRIERLRGLRFRHPVGVEVVSPAEARRVGLAEMARTEAASEQRAEEELLKLLGLLPPETSMRRVTSLVFAEQVAGFYEPRRGRLALVRGVGVDDVTLAHELTHALEDQHFDLERFGDGPDDDRATAEQALAEGTATLVMQDYAERWPSATPVGDALEGLTQVTGSTPLPAYVIRSLVFPYIQGEGFAGSLRDAAGGDWRLVDVALRDRPPVTSAEILDPDRWLRARAPEPIALGGTGALRAAGGWRRLAGSTLGAEDVAALLTAESGPLGARRLTAGWSGGRYALWRRGPLPASGCAAPCRSRDALQLALRMETTRQARRLVAALRRWIDALPDSSAGSVRIGGDGRTVRAALAPTPALADALTR